MESNYATNDKLNPTYSHDDNALSRTTTYQLSPEQYERLFLQPNAAKGDLAKRLGNPTLLGVLGFLVPFTSTLFCLLQFRGASSASLVGISGYWAIYGGIAMCTAGICEFILGNTFPFVVFVTFGTHWLASSYQQDPLHNLVSAYGKEGALSLPYNSGQAHYNIVMAMVCFVFMLGSLRTNVPFVIVFFVLIFLFGFFAAAQFTVGYATTAADYVYAEKLLKIAGGWGLVASLCGWYLAIIFACASTGVPCPLPIFDLSTKTFARNKAKVNEHAGAVQRGSVIDP